MLVGFPSGDDDELAPSRSFNQMKSLGLFFFVGL